jgi:predicted acylesterase/phospholipase RssA
LIVTSEGAVEHFSVIAPLNLGRSDIEGLCHMSDTSWLSADFIGEKPGCDLVMKGGITSGVVYPLAVVELARKYRFRSIGGTSAGALAAAITAAAEYGRENGGFERAARIPDEIAGSLFDKFQPDQRLKPLFRMLTATLGQKSAAAKSAAVVRTALSGYASTLLLGALPGLVLVAASIVWFGVGWALFGAMLALAGAIVMVVRRIIHAVGHEFPSADFGLCPGRTMAGGPGPGLTDWLADTIDHVAGHLDADGRPGPPLTFGDLERGGVGGKAIELATITTDLAMRRPYRLPFRDRLHFFSRAEFSRLFPARVVDHMTAHSDLLPEGQNVTGDLYYFPDPPNVPVVVAARMSLSFPGLIQAVPLYKCDHTLLQENDRRRPQRCLFSDGGLSSNFPIHFFDRLWPNRPTFAVALDRYSEQRHNDGAVERRVSMATDPREGQLLPIVPIKGIGGFVMTLLDAAKDWQDNLQSLLPGYRERIVHVALKPDEGGLNLTMPPELIKALTGYGKDAGRLATSAFDMDGHRWRRFLISMARVEETLDELAKAHDDAGASESFGAFLARFHFDRSYRPKDVRWKSEILKRAETLVELGREWRTHPTIRSGNIPKPDCEMRIEPQQ